MLFTKTKQPPKVTEGYGAIFIGERPGLLFGTEYAWSVVPKPPSRLTPNHFNKITFKFLSKLPHIV